MMEGFEAPVHRSLTEVILLGGLPRTVAILLWTVVAAIGLGLQQIWVLPFGFIVHIGLVFVTKKDPYFFDVFIRAIKTPKKLYP